ncbi:aldo/keto reductase [Vulgatibacter incomptus]|uniref:Aldo-keto reductase n=1 Tax=Vulgatibacter incomptus TaxID=1391653 RepID=A0A0K1PHD6_9BACT|nr:aldo/keto reductase [Vulgatibacter incomptus]AKU92534.1 Aldo-keto reductase [Vulgatibacter incomptus]
MSVEQAGILRLGGEVPVHRLGFGAMRITGEGIWGEPPDLDEAKRVLRRVVELGIDLIDTADSYGPDVSERLIGETLAPYPSNLVVATKAGLTRPGPNTWVPNGDPAHIRRACEGSLRRLRLDRIELYQFHRPDPKVPLEDSMGELVRLQNEGKIRFIGVSNFDVEQLERASGIAKIISVQNRFNLVDRASQPVLEWCERRGIAFIPWRPLSTEGLEGGPIAAIAKRHNASLPQIALAWILVHSPVMLPIPGTGSVKHLEDNVGATRIQLEPAEVLALTAVGRGA